MNCLFWACLIGLGLYIAILLTKFRLSLRTIQREPDGAAAFEADQITIVQPILGGDPRLAEVLATTLQNTPRAARFLWLVDRDDAPGQAAVETARKGHSERIEIIWCDPAPETVNPKIYKLDKAWPRIETPFFAVLDDDTTISDRNLRIAAAALARCDLYTGIPCYKSAGGFWDSLVTHFVNNNSIMTYLSMLPLVGPLSINGMFYVMRTETLRALGGFSSIRMRLCDDYAVARLLLDNGRRIHQGTAPQYLYTSVAGPRHYAQIMHRWFLFAGFLVQDQRLSVRFLLLVMLGLPALLLWAGLIGTSALTLAAVLRHADALYAVIAVGALGVMLTARHGLIRFLHGKIFDREAPFRPATSILSELLQPIHWLHSVLASEIQWRTRRIRVNRNNTFNILDA
jgi:ceramide glucosyltransferase